MSTESPKAPANEKATVPIITKGATRLRVMTIMIKKIRVNAAIAAIRRSDAAYCLMSLLFEPAPPMYTCAPASEVSFSAVVMASGKSFTCSMPSGPMALPMWVTMKRAALPSGDIISVIPVLMSSLSKASCGM
ncbi:Uncharacterised protein [Mycobacteroides abscessus subsp. abscessus]|nr:Uncharacterised protein [Mycobacteroides abscessus subsp. abscessus]